MIPPKTTPEPWSKQVDEARSVLRAAAERRGFTSGEIARQAWTSMGRRISMSSAYYFFRGETHCEKTQMLATLAEVLGCQLVLVDKETDAIVARIG